MTIASSPINKRLSSSLPPDSKVRSVPGKELVADHLRVCVHAWVNTHALHATDHLRDLALVDGTEAGDLGVVDHTGGGGKVLDEREVLQTSISLNLRVSNIQRSHAPCTYPKD